MNKNGNLSEKIPDININHREEEEEKEVAKWKEATMYVPECQFITPTLFHIFLKDLFENKMFFYMSVLRDEVKMR